MQVQYQTSAWTGGQVTYDRCQVTPDTGQVTGNR